MGWVGLDYKHQAEQVTLLSLAVEEKTSLNELINQARNFRKLISFFVGQKLRIERLIFYADDIVVKVIDPSKDYLPQMQPVELFYDDNETYRELPGRSVYYINFADIEPDFENIVKNWFSMIDSALSPVTDLMLHGITDHYFFDEADFLRAWQGVEAFHRIVLQDTPALKGEFEKWFNKIDEYITDKKLLKKIKGRFKHDFEPNARERLKFVMEQNADVLNLNIDKKKMNSWMDEIIASRNYLTHLDPQSIGRKAGTQNLFSYTGLLKALLMVLLFREMGLNEDLLKRVGNHSSFNLRGLQDLNF